MVLVLHRLMQVGCSWVQVLEDYNWVQELVGYSWVQLLEGYRSVQKLALVPGAQVLGAQALGRCTELVVSCRLVQLGFHKRDLDYNLVQLELDMMARVIRKRMMALVLVDCKVHSWEMQVGYMLAQLEGCKLGVLELEDYILEVQVHHSLEMLGHYMLALVAVALELRNLEQLGHWREALVWR